MRAIGVGNVLVWWLTIAGAFATAIALVLVLAGWSSQRLQYGRVRWRKLIPALVVPYATVAYVAAAFLVYALWCERVRGVDAGIGEYRRVPLANGYVLELAGTTGRAFIEDPAGERLPLRFDRVGKFDHLVFGRITPAEFFILDTQTGEVGSYPSEESLPAQLQLPDALYRQIRWGFPDVLALLLVISLPVIAILIWRHR